MSREQITHSHVKYMNFTRTNKYYIRLCLTNDLCFTCKYIVFTIPNLFNIDFRNIYVYGLACVTDSDFTAMLAKRRIYVNSLICFKFL